MLERMTCAGVGIAAVLAQTSAKEPPPPRIAEIDIQRTVVTLAAAPDDEAISGTQLLRFTVTGSGDRLRFDTGPLVVSRAVLDGTTDLVPKKDGGALVFAMPEGLLAEGLHRLSIDYETPLPDRGVTRSEGLLATSYFACDWMVCNQEDFADRFEMRLELDVPDGLSTLGPGVNVATSAAKDGRQTFVWAAREAYPAYVHAFAVGRMNRTDLEHDCEPSLSVHAPPGTPRLHEAFAPTCRMLRFFEEKAGLPFPRDAYAQLYLPGARAAQEAVSHSVIGGTFLDPILGDPAEDWVIAHELAHQWWGNGVTAADLSEFWLNEGVVTFMVAAWKEQAHGREAYEREIGLARRRWQGRLDRSGDAALAHEGPYASVGTRFSIQYSKGAVFLHELREAMGEAAFWAGMARFTREGYGRAVTSSDFERAMQAETDLALGPLFAAWVYGR